MSLYYDTKNNRYPLHSGDIENIALNNNDLLNYIKPVIETEKTEFDEKSEYVYEGLPILVDGEYYQNWVKRDLTEEEKTIKKDTPPMPEGGAYIYNPLTNTWESH